ncbi:hypothetical protein QR98_0084530 [Sarcoptes scabiei]|nr:hypothetical protein QR98_0084530 [Sarcoptes scabiei]
MEPKLIDPATLRREEKGIELYNANKIQSIPSESNQISSTATIGPPITPDLIPKRTPFTRKPPPGLPPRAKTKEEEPKRLKPDLEELRRAVMIVP